MLLVTPSIYAQINGCTDPLSLNYNKNAEINDGSCIYAPTTVEVSESYKLPDGLSETSGLIIWNGNLLTQNDSNDTHLYAINSLNGTLQDTYDLPNTKNKDWEEITQDAKYIYIGDFGNNSSGNRTDLHILRVEKESLLARNPKIDTISFHYGDQTDFSAKPANGTDFDCEAFFVAGDKMYLITKQWKNNKSVFYELPITPGIYTAKRLGTLDVEGLTTGCVYMGDKQILALSGYDHNLSPFVYLLYDFEGTDFLNGNKRKVKIDLSLHQVEAITSTDGLNYFITNESFEAPGGNVIPQQLHKLDLKQYLEGYIEERGLGLNEIEKTTTISVYPNPSKGIFQFKGIAEYSNPDFELINIYGKTIKTGNLGATNYTINLSRYAAGIYFLKLEGVKGKTLKLIKG